MSYFQEGLDSLPILGVFVVFSVVALISYEIWFRIGRWWQRTTPDEKEGPTGTLVGSLLGLMAFLLAITTGMASDRFDTRRGLVLTEANSIGTTFLRSGYLPEPARTESRKLLREYVPLRIVSDDLADLRAKLDRSVAIQSVLWSIAEELARTESDSDVLALYIESLNETIDLHETRVASSLYARVPETVPIRRVMREMQRSKPHMAAVVNEHGTVVGVITLENILEQLVGSVQWVFGDLFERFIWLAAVGYLCCALIRLARFNVENEEDATSHMSFTGLPSPAAAGVVGFLCLAVLSAYGYSFRMKTYPPGHIIHFVDDDHKYTIYGTIDNWPVIKEHNTDVIITVDSISLGGEIKRGKGRLLIHIGTETTDLRYGDQIYFNSSLYSIKGGRNPTGFDYRRYLNLKGVFAVAYLPHQYGIQIDPLDRGHFYRLVGDIRNYITDTFKRTLDSNAAALASGFLIGDTRDIPTEIYNRFRDSGTLHLLAVPKFFSPGTAGAEQRQVAHSGSVKQPKDAAKLARRHMRAYAQLHRHQATG